MKERELSTKNRNNYFSDGKTIIDFVIVIFDKELYIPESYAYITHFIGNLQERGLKFEVSRATEKGNLYVKINVPKRALRHYAKVYNINIRSPGHNLLAVDKPNSNIFDTPLTRYNGDVFQRKRGATSTERILITHEILSDTAYGRHGLMRGLSKLKSYGIIKGAYPLHDGPHEYKDTTPDSELNERQLLLKYWANFSLFYKKQPLNLIEKYYGTETAFYFAWVGFYNKMLIPASIVGLFCFVFNVISAGTLEVEEIGEYCNSHLLLCPACVNYESCFLKPLNNSCKFTKMHFVFDNTTTAVFSIFMSLWATVFLRLWRRVENILKIRWNVEIVEYDTKIRPAYKEKATKWRLSPVSGELEPFIPRFEILFYKFATMAICLCMLLLVCMAVIGVIIFRITMSGFIKKQYRSEARNEEEPFILANASIIVMVQGAIIQIIFIKLFGKFYGPLSVWLTTIENPRTQREFDHSVIIKRYYLGFANNYVPLFYIAFIKGRIYTPTNKDSSIMGIAEDTCLPTGCIIPLCIQLLFYMSFKSMFGNIWTLVVPWLGKMLCRYYKNTVKSKRKNHFEPQYEVEFGLEPSDQYTLTSEYMEMIIQYGFVTFFVAAFPLAPLCALINNAMELRLDAFKFVTRQRRPIPRKQAGIGTWNKILYLVTYISITTNAFVLAFTSDFVSRAIYRSEHNGSLKGYVNASFSEFDMTEFQDFSQADTHFYAYTDDLIRRNITRCYYKAQRYPPDHKYQYQLRNEYFYEIGLRLTCVIVFEHAMILFCSILRVFIPEIPQKLHLAIENTLYKREKYLVSKLSENVNNRSSIEGNDLKRNSEENEEKEN